MMYIYPPYYGKIATEYDESYSLLQMVGNLNKRVSALERGLIDTNQIITLLSSKIHSLTMQTIYIDNRDVTEIDIYHNNQYVLKRDVELLTLHTSHYTHDCNCDNCTCNVQSKDGFICEISLPFTKKKSISELVQTDGKFKLKWCNDIDISDMTNATVVIWWDGNMWCGAVGKYGDQD